MATRDTSAQFQEPPVAELPEATSTCTTVDATIDAQFQERVSPPRSTETLTPTSTSNATDGGALHKSTSEKLVDAVKKPFSSKSTSSAAAEIAQGEETLGDKRITSPEMAAANEVLKAQDMKSL